MTFTTPYTYNDDKWHLIDVRRDGKTSLLKVDEIEIETGTCDGPESYLKVGTLQLYYYIFVIMSYNLYTY